MKRLFTYILALSLLPQIASAIVVVGKTEGTFAVSPKGAATYTIPLTIPKGMSDFKPELSLVYDSQDGNGIMGLGWSIKGLHAITKVPKCKHFDGENFSGTAYALDGMRMILGIGVDGQTGALYKTEHDQGDIISITAAQNGMPTTFKIKAADGSIYKYGSSTGRYINGDNSKWALDYAQDALGNYISYTYDQNGGLYPTSITYGRNIHGTAGVNCVISFTYDDSTPKRLTKIECKCSANRNRSYTFCYAEDSPSHLISVTEGGKSVYTFAPTTFEWEQNRISSITDGLGATESFTYSNLNGNVSYSRGRAIQADPNKIFRLVEGTHTGIMNNIYVIASRTESIPTDSKTTDYSYERGVYHNEGKGFLGFARIEAKSTTGVKYITYCNVDSACCVLLPKESKLLCNSNYYYEHKWFLNTIEIERVGDSTYRTRTTYNATDAYVDGCSNAQYCCYSNGLLYKIENVDGLYEVSDYTTTYWESPNDTIRIKGLPSEIETKKVSYSDNVDDIYDKTTYERDPNTGLVLKETRKRGEDTLSTDGYTYNEYGQVTSHWTVAYNSTDTLVTTYEYNTSGQLYREYNPLGQRKTYTYNKYHGYLESFVDFDGSTTSFTYDGMDRETKYDGPSKVVTTSRKAADYGGSVYAVVINDPDKPYITTYYDAWGRRVAESIVYVGSSKSVYTDYKYNSIGKIGFVSFPHEMSEEGTLGTNYYYDEYMHRLVRTEDSNGKVNTWTYNGDDVRDYTSCIDGVKTYSNHPSPDLTDKVIYEDGSGIHYLYNADGKILKAIATFVSSDTSGSSSQTKETNYEYDNCGRLSRIVDMNGVTKEYTYDKNGYPKKTIVDGSTIETNYDKYGRLMSKSWTGPDGDSHTVTYTYNTDVKKKHLVAKEQGDNYIYNYTYDNYGKLTIKSREVFGSSGEKSVSSSFGYNSQKTICRKSSTLRFVKGNYNLEERFGYRNGEISNDTLIYPQTFRWWVVKQDKWGNITKEKGFGNKPYTEYSFDDYGHMLSMQNVSLTERSYSYDMATGNMTEENGISLTYDNMNRLTGWGNHTYSYDKKGNITHHSLVGDFSYEGFKLKEMRDSDNFNYNHMDTITYYTALERPKSIENDHYKAEFSYDGDGNRILMEVYKKESGQYMSYFTRYYFDGYIEINVDSLGKEKAFYYAGNDAQNSHIVVEVTPNGNGTNKTKIWNVVRDNVENVMGYVRSSEKFEFSYSSWGVRTAVNDVTAFSMPGESLGDCPFYRTYRGYEDLWMFGLMYDKTRLYDPYLGRYLSPNPVYNITDGPFDHNPYVFSKNNPFRIVK